MSRYTLFEGSPNFIQNDGTAFLNNEVDIDDGTVRGGGNVAANGPAQAIEKVELYQPKYGNKDVAGINNAVGAAVWQVSNLNQSIANGTGKWAGSDLLTDTAHGLVAGDVVRIIDGNAGNAKTGVYRVVEVITANTYVINSRFTGNVAANLDVYHAEVTVSGGTVKKPVGYLTAGRYATRVVGLPIFNGVITVNTLVSPASEYGRRKVHSRTAVRTKLVEVAIRNGFWNPFTATFTTPVGVQNDFTAFGVDDEVQDSNFGFGTKGEFAYRMGITVTQDEYEV